MKEIAQLLKPITVSPAVVNYAYEFSPLIAHKIVCFSTYTFTYRYELRDKLKTVHEYKARVLPYKLCWTNT